MDDTTCRGGIVRVTISFVRIIVIIKIVIIIIFIIITTLLCISWPYTWYVPGSATLKILNRPSFRGLRMFRMKLQRMVW
jgi:hypothetical protein